MDKLARKLYLEIVKERARTSRVRAPHQHAGLELAAILSDKAHKTLYMKLSKEYDSNILFAIARDIAQRKNVKNKAAYFMKVFSEMRKILPPKTLPKKPKQLRLKFRRKK